MLFGSLSPRHEMT